MVNHSIYTLLEVGLYDKQGLWELKIRLLLGSINLMVYNLIEPGIKRDNLIAKILVINQKSLVIIKNQIFII